MRRNDRIKIYAILGTLLFHAAVVVYFVFSFLKFPSDDMKEFPPAEENEIIFDEVEELYASGDFVRTGDNIEEIVPADEPAPSAVEAKEPTQDANDIKNSGKPAEPKQVVKSERPSPMKVENKPKGPTKEELEQEKARQEAKRQQEARKNAADATKKAFGGGKGKGTPGSANGNSDSGATTGQPGNGVAGRSLEHWSSVSSRKTGEIVIRVKVNAQGHVVEATYQASGSNGAAAADPAMRNSCISQSLKCRFSVQENAPVQTGTITWRFR